ncbi:MAG: amidohydrolase [Chloroflexota bacterium]
MTTDLVTQAQALFEYTQGLRRDFHRHPELGFQEFRTAGVIARELGALGLPLRTGVAETGVVAALQGARPGPLVLLRFDIDALPVTEETGAEYASQNPGVMHACGHDGHTAIGLTVARLLHARRDQIAGSVRLVFQPAEEGMGGAERMVAEGVLRQPVPDLALALHLWNERPVGWIGAANGPCMAAAEVFHLRILGKGGHGALPHLAVDPVLACAQVISALQSIVARSVSPLDTAVVSVTLVRGGETFNVIPPEVELQGTIRTFDPATRQVVLQRFRELVTGVAAAHGCQAEIKLESLTPAVINDPRAAARVRQAAGRLFPGIQVDSDFRTMGSEDMAFMLQEVPGCFFFVGSADPARGLDASHHHPRFDFDERALPLGAALITAATLDFLNS